MPQKPLNKRDWGGWWIGYFGGLVIVTLLTSMFPLPPMYDYTYSTLVIILCAEITARYRPRFWDRQDQSRRP